MYRFNVGESYKYCDTVSFEPIDLSIDSSKLFHLDEFNINPYTITYSQVRNNIYIAGVLDLSKTYGRDNKLLYACKPDDKRIPTFLIPYSKPPTFDKSIRYLYVTFQFKHWDKEHPYGTLTHTIGNVEHTNHIYEYMLYCKSLNHPIQSFTKKAIEELKNHNDMPSFPVRTGHIFTIDSTKSVDYDDAISIRGNIISVYISNVPIILDHLNLWESFSNRISTIYLPDKKRSMIPNVLTDCVCSLKQKTSRICLVMDIEYRDNKVYSSNISICKALISRNYAFEEDKLLQHKDYIAMKDICKVKSSYDLISKLMIDYNQQCAILLKKHETGIYKNISYIYKQPHTIMDHIEKFKQSASRYELFHKEAHYSQITSPIRRLVDLLNMYLICKHEQLYTFTDKAETFYMKWIQQLDYINTTTRYIRKLQSKCKLISIFEKEQHKVFKGFLFDKIKRSDNKFHYNVYLPELNIFSSLSLNEDLVDCSEKSFKLFMFNDEALLKKKLKLIIITSKGSSTHPWTIY